MFDTAVSMLTSPSSFCCAWVRAEDNTRASSAVTANSAPRIYLRIELHLVPRHRLPSFLSGEVNLIPRLAGC